VHGQRRGIRPRSRWMRRGGQIIVRSSFRGRPLTRRVSAVRPDYWNCTHRQMAFIGVLLPLTHSLVTEAYVYIYVLGIRGSRYAVWDRLCTRYAVRMCTYVRACVRSRRGSIQHRDQNLLTHMYGTCTRAREKRPDELCVISLQKLCWLNFF
jgi:hypothetical protein